MKPRPLPQAMPGRANVWDTQSYLVRVRLSYFCYVVPGVRVPLFGGGCKWVPLDVLYSQSAAVFCLFVFWQYSPSTWKELKNTTNGCGETTYSECTCRHRPHLTTWSNPALRGKTPFVRYWWSIFVSLLCSREKRGCPCHEVSNYLSWLCTSLFFFSRVKGVRPRAHFF